MYAETVKFSGMKNSEFEKNINAQIQRSIDSDLVAFDSKAQECKDNLQMGNKCVMEIGWEETYNKNDFISVVEEKYIYTGGARGTTVHIPVNIDVSGEKEVKLADLFADSEEYKDLWAKPEIKQEHQTDFYIQDDDLVIFFQPYDLSYYARGFVEFRLDLEDLSGYMKEEYRRMID